MRLLIRIYTNNDYRENILDIDTQSVHKDYLLECLEMIKKYIEQLDVEIQDVHTK